MILQINSDIKLMKIWAGGPRYVRINGRAVLHKKHTAISRIQAQPFF